MVQMGLIDLGGLHMHRTLMSGPAWVSYAQIYVESSEDSSSMEECFAGQRNGLCGAAAPGRLFLLTGLHTGQVAFAVELYDDEPVIDDSWEEIVEASYRPLGQPVLVEWGGGAGSWELDLQPQVDYRVRYCGWGMDTAHQTGRPEGEPPVDRYLLQFWPAPPAPDRVVKMTSRQAAYSHESVRNAPPPPSPEQQARVAEELERIKAEARETNSQNAVLAAWGGPLPSERVRKLWHANDLARLDRPLLDALERAGENTQFAVARWSVRRALCAANLDQVEWIAAALDGMDRGQSFHDAFKPPPGTFGDGPHAVATSGDWDPRLSGPIQAMLTLRSAGIDDPLVAAIASFWLAVGATGNDPALLEEVRQAFPELGDQAW